VLFCARFAFARFAVLRSDRCFVVSRHLRCSQDVALRFTVLLPVLDSRAVSLVWLFTARSSVCSFGARSESLRFRLPHTAGRSLVLRTFVHSRVRFCVRSPRVWFLAFFSLVCTAQSSYCARSHRTSSARLVYLHLRINLRAHPLTRSLHLTAVARVLRTILGLPTTAALPDCAFRI